MSVITKVATLLKGEPVAVATVVGAAFALVAAVRAGNVTEGVVTAAVIAVAGLFARHKVSPV